MIDGLLVHYYCVISALLLRYCSDIVALLQRYRRVIFAIAGVLLRYRSVCVMLMRD
ncbi:hypothetical protein [Insulibacter thermoxylanivorax]|uniref:hypothetical protein n=1 Tax=Insulibacter thermoxylanivorax TaxID=2749268 RepID=UPI001910CE87|nr:hypothetical protein [Insulibacter thermoxylanivorax]